MRKIALSLSALTLASACASSSENVTAERVSTLSYKENTCEELIAERESLRKRIVVVAEAQDDKAAGDAAAMAVGTLIFLPALAFMAAGEDKSGELGRLKGEFDAVTEVAKEKDCIPPEQLERERVEAEEAKAALEAIKNQRHSATDSNAGE